MITHKNNTWLRNTDHARVTGAERRLIFQLHNEVTPEMLTEATHRVEQANPNLPPDQHRKAVTQEINKLLKQQAQAQRPQQQQPNAPQPRTPDQPQTPEPPRPREPTERTENPENPPAPHPPAPAPHDTGSPGTGARGEGPDSAGPQGIIQNSIDAVPATIGTAAAVAAGTAYNIPYLTPALQWIWSKFGLAANTLGSWGLPNVIANPYTVGIAGAAAALPMLGRASRYVRENFAAQLYGKDTAEYKAEIARIRSVKGYFRNLVEGIKSPFRLIGATVINPIATGGTILRIATNPIRALFKHKDKVLNVAGQTATTAGYSAGGAFLGGMLTGGPAGAIVGGTIGAGYYLWRKFRKGGGGVAAPHTP